MIAADTSTWVAFLEGGAGEDAQLLDKGPGRPPGGYGSRCVHRAVKRPRAPYRRCPNSLRSAFEWRWNLAIGAEQESGGRRCWRNAVSHASALRQLESDSSRLRATA
jgi:hypothetical protein